MSEKIHISLNQSDPRHAYFIFQLSNWIRTGGIELRFKIFKSENTGEDIAITSETYFLVKSLFLRRCDMWYHPVGITKHRNPYLQWHLPIHLTILDPTSPYNASRCKFLRMYSFDINLMMIALALDPPILFINIYVKKETCLDIKKYLKYWFISTGVRTNWVTVDFENDKKALTVWIIRSCTIKIDPFPVLVAPNFWTSPKMRARLYVIICKQIRIVKHQRKCIKKCVLVEFVLKHLV